MSVCADAFVFIVYVVYTLLYTFIMVYILHTCHLSHSPLSSLPRPPPPTVLHYNILVQLIIFVCLFFVIFILSGSLSLSAFRKQKNENKKMSSRLRIKRIVPLKIDVGIVMNIDYRYNI